MTTLAAIRALYAYHEWADLRLLDAAARLPEEELSREAGIPFGSVQGNLLHILGSQVSWVMRLTNEAPRMAALEPGGHMVPRGVKAIEPLGVDGKTRPAQLRQCAAFDDGADLALQRVGRLRPRVAGGQKRERQGDERAQTQAVPEVSGVGQRRASRCSCLADVY